MNRTLKDLKDLRRLPPTRRSDEELMTRLDEAAVTDFVRPVRPAATVTDFTQFNRPPAEAAPVRVAAPLSPPGPRSVREALRAGLASRAGLRQALLLQEVLGPPVGLRQRDEGRPGE